LILQYAPAFYFASASLLIAVLHLLRTRMRRRDVATLRLWEGLRGDPHSRTIRLRQLIDPLLFLQLLTLLALVVALARPAAVTEIRGVSDLAIVVDGSASMQTMTEDGRTRYVRALEEAKAALARFAAASVTVVHLTAHPEVLGTEQGTRAEAIRALGDSSASWDADGSLNELSIALTPYGGIPSFDRVVLVSDRTFADLPASIEQVLVGGGRNVGITAFSVREDPQAVGAVAFVEVLNTTDEYAEVTIKITDGSVEVSLPEVLPPTSKEPYVFPFPESRGTTFSVRLLPGDDYAGDDVRYFALDRPLSLRLRWIGERDEYTLAALRAVAPVTLVGTSEEADLTIVRNTSIPASLAGNVLLLHAEIPGVFELAGSHEGDPVEIRAVDHPLADGIDPGSLRVFTLPEMRVPGEATVVLTSGDRPLLAEASLSGRMVFAIAADLTTTNLPVTVDFPLLIRNILGRITRLPASLSYGWDQVGSPIDVRGLGSISTLIGPDGEAIPLRTGQRSFLPEGPGIYTLETDRGVFPIAANVSPGESAAASLVPVAGSGSAPARAMHGLLALWPYVAALAALGLTGEAILRDRWDTDERRGR